MKIRSVKTCLLYTSPLDEEDWDGWELLTTRLGLHTQLVGDDLFVTNTKRLKKGIEKEVANAIDVNKRQV